MIIIFIVSLIFLLQIQICKSLFYKPYNESFTLDKLNEHIDWKVDPCTDFHEFVCGTYFKNNLNEDKNIKYAPESNLSKTDFKKYYDILESFTSLKGFEKIFNILDYFENTSYSASDKEKLTLSKLETYSHQHILLNYLLEHPNIKHALQFAKEIYKDMNEETILLIKEKDWLDEETKEMFLEKLKTLKFNFIIHKDIANNEYFNYCIDAIPFDSSKLPHEVLEDITNYFKNDSYYPDNGKISCSEIIEFAIFNKHKNGVYISKYNLLTITLPLIMDPYFNKQFPIPLNYGLLAETIGHEILHAFDTSHRIFDQYGNLRSITTEKSDEEFQIRERCLIDQYSNQTIEGTDENVNGVRTLNENLGDNGGVKLAYRTYLKYVKRLNYNMKPLKGKKELSPDQLFFVSGGRFWCSKKSKQSSSKGVDENVHAPAKNRFNTYISNFKPFSEAFNCKIGTPMNPKNKCEVWRHK